MAKELTVSASLSFVKSAISAALAKTGVQFDVSGSTFAEGAATVTTSPTAIPLGSVATPGYLLAMNLDGTNYVQILDSAAGNACVKLKAGEVCVFRCATSAPAWKANVASCSVLYLVISD